MLRNYITVAVRNILRFKGYAAINILGLAIGMATCIIIVRYVQDETSYDAWHPGADRIYRVLRETRAGGQSEFQPGTSAPLAQTLEADFPDVEEAVRVWPSFGEVNKGDERLYASICATDPEFFELFDFPVLRGDIASVFAHPHSIAVTEKAAKRFFGEEDPLGRIIRFHARHHGGEKKIVAILKQPPTNSTIELEFVSGAVFSKEAVEVWDAWRPTHGWRPIQTYFRLREGADPLELTRKFPALIERSMGPEIEKANAYHLQSLTRVRLYSKKDFGSDLQVFGETGDIDRVTQFGAIALLVLAIGCINFANLSTALSTARAKEVGLRKVAGGLRLHLMSQFLSESMITSLAACGVGVVIAKLVLPEFNAFFHKQLQLDFLGAPLLVVFVLAIAVIVGVAAGLYPAVYLSSFEPTETLKGTFHGGGGRRIRRALVVAQFAISIMLIVGTGVVYQQIEFLLNKDLGYDADQMVIVPVFEIDAGVAFEEERLTDRYEAVKQAFLGHPNVLEATAYRWWLGWGSGLSRTVHVEGHEGTDWRMGILEVDDDYIDVFRIEMLQGRKFDLDTFPTDTSGVFVLNEAAVKTLGWDDLESSGPLGKEFKWVDRDISGRVIGVVKDFHFSSLRDPVGPVALTIHTNQFYCLGMRIKSEGVEETVAHFETLWKQFAAGSGGSVPFFHQFFDQQFEDIYFQERRVQKLTLYSSFIAILLACMGLFGLASFAMEERRKEIGVRKSLGASVPSVIVLVSREFLVMVVIAAVIATPVGWHVMNGWLANFAYRMEIGAGVFAIGTLVALAIAQLTVTFHAQRAARMDPVKALRYE
jgi:putative ABC transport system permease protein